MCVVFQAADYFKGEESNSSANKCMLKVAQYAAQLENYEKAIKIYETVSFVADNTTRNEELNLFNFSTVAKLMGSLHGFILWHH